jgi:hypothetical protein
MTALSVTGLYQKCTKVPETKEGKVPGYRHKSLPCLVLETGLEPALP